MPTHRLPEKLFFGGVKGLAALGLSMMMRRVTVKAVVIVGGIRTHRTSCSGHTRLALHVPSSS